MAEKEEEGEQSDVVGLLDALPYYDKEFEDDSIRREVLRLIREESERMNEGEKDYVSHHPELPQIQFDQEKHPFLYELQERVRNNRTDEKMYDEKRYDMSSIFSKNMNSVAKENSDEMKKIMVQMGFLRQQRVHLMLLKENAKSAWLSHNQQVKDAHDSYVERGEEVKESVTEVNKKRKRDQVRFGESYDRMKLESERLDDDIARVENECNRVRKKRKLQQNCEKY